MEEKYLLSVIVPVYNCGKYLPRCVESLLAAGRKDLQIVLVDDGSRDNSGSVCDGFAKAHDCVIALHKANGGPSSARNLGIEGAEGRYIGFADSDDYVDPVAFARTLDRLAQSDADIWVSDFFRVSNSGVILDRVRQIEGDAPICTDAYKLRFFSMPDCHWNVWRCIYRRGYLNAVPLRFTEGVSCGEDLEFAVAAYMKTDSIVYFHNPYYYYRVNYGETLMHSVTAKRAEELVRMLHSTDALLRGIGGAEAEKLREKLAREYILNLSLCAEADGSEREKIRAALEAGADLLESAGGVYKVAAEFVKLCGMPLSSRLLLAAKRIKRRRRNRKNGS